MTPLFWEIYAYLLKISSTRLIYHQKVPPTSDFLWKGQTPLLGETSKMRKWPYLSPDAPNPKNKDTFFSATLKVEENKVPLLFGLEAPWKRYGHFLILMKATT